MQISYVKRKVRSTIRAILPKLCGNCTFPQNFHTRKLGEITALYVVDLVNLFICDRTLKRNLSNIRTL